MITVKLVGSDDLHLLLSADVSVFDDPVQPDLARAYLAHPDYLIALACEGSKVVGMASGLFYFHPDKPLEFFVNEVGVAESHQRRGIAKRLMEVLFDAARKRGVAYAWVGTEADNVPAKALYSALNGKGQSMAYYEFDLKA
ncbi:GNAT family N-acetyltransferase [Pelagibacterium sp.]|uniref:GNAT family N-acetyltransferase n=1 Tax=Pelagibacterium sp. TaxID=1967288 RepID=UPI003A94480B